MRAVPPGIELRRARPDELGRVIAFVRAGIDAYRSWAPDWTPVDPSPERRAKLAELFADDERAWVLLALDEAGQLAGLVSLSRETAADARPPRPGTIYLWQLFAAPAWQGTGLAQALMDRAIEEARRRGFSRITLWAAEGAAQARCFYEREGWTPTGERDDGARFGLPLIQYEHNLKTEPGSVFR